MMEKRGAREKIYIYGKHALQEALLSAPRSLRKVYLSPANASPELLTLLGKHKIAAAELGRDRAGELLGKDASHQGVVALVDPSALLVSLEQFLQTLDMGTRPAIAIPGE